MAEVNGVKSPAVGSRPRNKKEVSFRPATLNVIARKHKPARSIGMNSTWVAILHHTIKDDAEADKEGAFQWVICMPVIPSLQFTLIGHAFNKYIAYHDTHSAAELLLQAQPG